jgi:transmembrane sensor
LAAGEQATVSAGGHIVTRSSPELVAQVGAWRERRLVFRGDSLDRVADEFNRYNALVIRIEGDGIRNKHLTGVFDADDPESLVLFLAQDSDMTVDRRGEAIVIRSR